MYGTECVISVWKCYRQRRKRRGEQSFFEMSLLFDSVDIASCFLGAGHIVCLVPGFITAASVFARQFPQSANSGAECQRPCVRITVVSLHRSYVLSSE